MRARGDRCQLEAAVRVLGRPCKVLILYECFRGVRHFNALQRVLPTVTATTLSRNLKELERDRLIVKRVHASKEPNTEYVLTSLGMTARPLVMALHEWGRVLVADRAAASKTASS